MAKQETIPLGSGAGLFSRNHTTEWRILTSILIQLNLYSIHLDFLGQTSAQSVGESKRQLAASLNDVWVWTESLLLHEINMR